MGEPHPFPADYSGRGHRHHDGDRGGVDIGGIEPEHRRIIERLWAEHAVRLQIRSGPALWQTVDRRAHAEVTRIGRRAGHAGTFGGEESIGAGVSADRKSTRLNSSHSQISYAVFCLKKKNREL